MGANAGATALLGDLVPPSVTTMVGSGASVAFGVIIMPLDTLKTTLHDGRQRRTAACGTGFKEGRAMPVLMVHHRPKPHEL